MLTIPFAAETDIRRNADEVGCVPDIAYYMFRQINEKKRLLEKDFKCSGHV